MESFAYLNKVLFLKSTHSSFLQFLKTESIDINEVGNLASNKDSLFSNTPSSIMSIHSKSTLLSFLV